MNRALRPLALVAALAFGAGAVAFAHGGHDHLMGTVKAVDTKSRRVEVETRDGKRVSVLVDDDTKYLRGQVAVKAAELVAGLRVVIDARKADGKLLAKEIRLGTAPK